MVHSATVVVFTPSDSRNLMDSGVEAPLFLWYDTWERQTHHGPSSNLEREV
jgi:hypothetical protein